MLTNECSNFKQIISMFEPNLLETVLLELILWLNTSGQLLHARFSNHRFSFATQHWNYSLLNITIAADS